MKKSTKGAIAAVGAAALLLGGAGTIAYWTADATVQGATITAGELTLTEATAGACDAAPWLLDGELVAIPDMLVVPGDQVTKTCTFLVTATGEHLEATAAVDTPTVTGDTNLVAVAADFELGGVALNDGGIVTSDDSGKSLVATITVDVDQLVSADNGTQGAVAVIEDVVVTLTQNHPVAP